MFPCVEVKVYIWKSYEFFGAGHRQSDPCYAVEFPADGAHIGIGELEIVDHQSV